MRAPERPIVIAHRGASAFRPEHTLASYELAIALGADYIEPDLVPTRDGVLVARHENDITATTDVGERGELAERRAVKVVDGEEHAGWFTEDLSWDELRTLRARERIPELRPAGAAFDGQEEVPAFESVLELARDAGVGVYPETKHPAYFRGLGLALEEPLAAMLRRFGMAGRDAPVFLQSFEPDSLRRLAALVACPRVLLTSPRRGADLSPDGLRRIAEYADAIGPHKDQVTGELVADAHAAGLLVHPWTFRPENAFLPEALQRGDPSSPEHPRVRGDFAAELRAMFELGVDGVFADDPGAAVAVREAWARG